MSKNKSGSNKLPDFHLAQKFYITIVILICENRLKNYHCSDIMMIIEDRRVEIWIKLLLYITVRKKL